jgi:hypothetical protein
MTKLRFLIDSSGNVFAYFPDILKKYTSKCDRLPSCSSVYANECERALPAQYMPLLNELQSIGYTKLHVL